MIVLDASAALKMILRQRGSEALVERVIATSIHAPALIEVEVVSGFRRLERQRLIAADRAAISLEWFLSAAPTVARPGWNCSNPAGVSLHDDGRGDVARVPGIPEGASK